MEILITAFYIVVCVLLFALAILVHEFGHFIVALKLGLRVEAFSIGFGPALWKRTYRGVEYRISAIPLGGYVSLPDLDPEGTKVLESSAKGSGNADTKSAPPRAPLPPWKEVLVAFAGPFMNIVLAVVLAVALSLVPSARFGTLPAILGEVIEDGPAAEAGLQAGDVIVAINGHPIVTWTDMQTEVQISGGKEVVFEIERKGDTGKFQTHCPRLMLPVVPERDPVTGAYFIKAISLTNATGAAAWMPDRNPLKQLAWDAGSIFRVLKGLVTPKEAKATAGALGGPVMIAEGLYRQVRRDPFDGIGFLRFLNVNLAVLNLLPIPVLDGGLILFSLFALVFRRRIPEFIVKNLSLVFMVLLMGLMGLLIVKDSWRTWKIHTHRCGEAETNLVEQVESFTNAAEKTAK